MEHSMNIFPDPGDGYRIRERLGGGAWKTAYRASTTHGLRDVAILYFHDKKKDAEFRHELKNLIEVQSHEYSSYVARLEGFNRDKKGQYYIIEELIVRPLEAIAPVRDMAKFARIARDLSRALICIHESNLVHRDLKLDNCGMDNQDRAKIFDLGSLTSEPGTIEATILSRAPELFLRRRSPKAFVKSADIFALGATLFALRCGEYPFVHMSEISERRRINADALDGKIDQSEAEHRKKSIDDGVKKRVTDPSAEETLRAKIHDNFRGDAEKCIMAMLEFEPSSRETIRNLEKRWSEIVARYDGGSTSMKSTGKSRVEELKRFLGAAAIGDISLSAMQVDRMHKSFEERIDDLPEKEVEDIQTLFEQVKGSSSRLT